MKMLPQTVDMPTKTSANSLGHWGKHLSYHYARFAVLILVSCLGACGAPTYERIAGQTMGTYFAVAYEPASDCTVREQALHDLLRDLNDSMSTYVSDSELSRFNSQANTEYTPISDDLYQVVRAAQDVWTESQGAFDVTVGPLVNLWGFGPQLADQQPNGADRELAFAAVGMDKIELQDGALRKSRPEIYIDLSALAKGFAVDVLAEHVAAQGCANYMVDIGGEIRTAGVNSRGQAWRVGIEVPDAQLVGALHAAVEVSGTSIATSGDYRNFRMVDGRRVDHVIDPRSGAPAENRVVSATVVHPSAMLADAYATTLMVLGWQEAFEFAERRELAVYIMRRSEAGAEPAFESRYNAAMKPYLVNKALQ